MKRSTFFSTFLVAAVLTPAFMQTQTYACGQFQQPSCEDVHCDDDDNECTQDLCLAGICGFMAVADGTACGSDVGICQQGSCQVACTEQGIRDAIAAGGGPYTFDCGGPTTVATATEIVIDTDVILDGEGNLTVDANQAHRVFSIPEGVTAELIGFTVTGGVATAGDGGGILNAGTFVLTSSIVTANTATIDGGGVGNAAGATLTLTNTTVQGNTADRLAGGLMNETLGTVTLNSTSVLGNHSPWVGGGISNGGIMILNDSDVSQNSGQWHGGINNDHALTLNSSTVSENSAEADGGGIGNQGAVTLNNSTVSGNTAGINGGGLASSGTLTLSNSTVSGNTATTNVGGGIFTFGKTTLTNTTVSGNAANGPGGGIWNDRAALALTDSTVTGNSTAAYGGGIDNSGTLTVTNSAVHGNSAATFAGGIQNWGYAELIDSNVHSNEAGDFGGGVDNNGTLVLTNMTVANNTTSNGGGGIFNHGNGVMILSNSTVSENTALNNNSAGGGVQNYGEATLVDSILIANTAGHYGGLFNVGTATVTGTKVEGNHSTSGSGAGIGNEGTITLIDTTVAGNQVRWHGGGIANGASMVLINSTVSGNTAIYGGGIWNYGGTLVLTNSTVSGNSATEATGGGIVNEATMTLISTTVAANSAAQIGTAIWNTGTAILRNTLIAGDCDFTTRPDSLGGNIESEGNTCGLGHPTDQVSVPALLLSLVPLQDNGGPTMTHALLPGSAAIDWVPVGACVDADGFPLLTDQRGVARPQGPLCDVGSVEVSSLCEGVDCDDQNECTWDQCNTSDGSCSHDPVPNGSYCDFGGAPGLCVDGECVAELCAGVDCDYGNQCILDQCDPASGLCFLVPDDWPCDLLGVGDGVCLQGECVELGLCEAVDCTSGNECVQDGTCDPADGQCILGDNTLAGEPCGLFGVGDGVCDGAGTCVECNDTPDCGEADQCLVWICVETSCVEEAVPDGTECDALGTCLQGICVAPPP
jgi:hypothetical protein